MLIAINIVVTLISVPFYLYFFWKKLKDDYSQSQVFSAGYYGLIGLVLGYLVSSYFRGHGFWLSFVGSAVGVGIAVKRFKMRFFEVFEAWVIASLNVLFVFESYQLIFEFSWVAMIKVFVDFVLIILFFLISGKYKRYVWYKSGKVGFPGLLVTGLYFIFRASNLVFSGIINSIVVTEVLFCLILASASFIVLYSLSKREL